VIVAGRWQTEQAKRSNLTTIASRSWPMSGLPEPLQP